MFNTLLPIQDQRRVGACHAPYAYKGRVRAISHACAFHRSSSARTRLPCTSHVHARVTSSPGLPDLNGHVHVHMVFGEGWAQLGLKSSHYCTFCAGQDETGPVQVLLSQHIRLQESRTNLRTSKLKPRSAIAWSPGSIFSRKPLLRVNSGCDIQSVNNRDTKITAPLGAIHTRAFSDICTSRTMRNVQLGQMTFQS